MSTDIGGTGDSVLPHAAGSADPRADLESVLLTVELTRRPPHAADYAAENQALVALAQELYSPGDILQSLVEAAITLCNAHSAGISLLHEDGQNFYWRTITGRWAPYVGGTLPRALSPCGTVLDRNAPQLFSHPEHHFPCLVSTLPTIEEGLLIPFYVAGRAVGTIWIIAHDASRRFDAEDLRVMSNLSQFASAAYQMLGAREQLEAELTDTKRLQGLSSQLLPETDIPALYEKIMDAAVSIMRSDFASIQMYYPERGSGGELRLLASHGFKSQAVKFWEWVRADFTMHMRRCVAHRSTNCCVGRGDSGFSSWHGGPRHVSTNRHPRGAKYSVGFARREIARNDFHALAKAAPAFRARSASA